MHKVREPFFMNCEHPGKFIGSGLLAKCLVQLIFVFAAPFGNADTVFVLVCFVHNDILTYFDHIFRAVNVV